MTPLELSSFEDFDFVNRIWSEDSEAQKLKLSEKQKQILKELRNVFGIVNTLK